MAGLINVVKSPSDTTLHLEQSAVRMISTVDGSLRDVQMLAGHSALSTTQRYIEADAEAQKRVVDLV